MFDYFGSKGQAIAQDVEMTAAGLYQVRPDYQRFDQMKNMTRQSLWNPAAVELSQKRRDNLEKLMKGNHSGYDLKDWAFYTGAIANMVNSGFSVNWPNRKGNSWEPLAKRAHIPVMAPYQSRKKAELDRTTATQLIRKVSQQFGADSVGFCNLDRRWVYSHWFDEKTREHYPIKFSDEQGYEGYQDPTELEDKTQVIPEKMKYVVVLIHEMDELGMATAPSLTQMATTFTAYSRISFTTVMVAEFIRGLGYHAIPSANDTALNIPLAIDAGLGELGRNAKLITPRFGPRCRISKVITDLPLVPGHARPWGVTQFCNTCMKCAKHCPTGAIPEGDRSYEPVGDFNSSGVLQWQIDHMKCYEYWTKVGTNCGLCIRTCPFNKSKHWSHSLVRRIIRKGSKGMDAFLVSMDDLFGYGRAKKSEDFWMK